MSGVPTAVLGSLVVVTFWGVAETSGFAIAPATNLRVARPRDKRFLGPRLTLCAFATSPRAARTRDGAGRPPQGVCSEFFSGATRSVTPIAYSYIAKQERKATAMTTIQMKDVLPKWTPATAMSHRNLTLVPLRGEGHQGRFQDYLLASEAIDAGVLTVTEVDESGAVPELLAVNDADKPVLLLDGEELQGAKQDRILNTTVLLPPKSKTRIPVSCVEQGRWSHTSPTFRTGNYAPSSLRRRKSRDVQYSLRARGRAESDQGAVWESVAEHIDACAAASPTLAMSDALATLSGVLGRYQEALPYPSGTCGVVAAVSGRFVAADAFDSPSTLEGIWGRLVASYAVDAEAAKDEAVKLFTAKAVEVLLEHVADQRCQAFDAVGLGRDLRFEADDVFGQGLCVENHLLHLSVFPPPSNRPQRESDSPPISPPSQRHR